MISLVGLNHKTASLDERSLFAPLLTQERVRELMEKTGASEAVALFTCNRFELYTFSPFRDSPAFSDDHSSETRQIHKSALSQVGGDELEENFYWYGGKDAVVHLFRVTSALDSLVVGESQIGGQVKDALLQAREWKTAGPILERLFSHSFSSAKKVRSETGVGRYPVSVASVAVQLADSIFEDLSRKQVLLLGAGKMAELVCKGLAKRGVRDVVVVNRTRARAVELAERYSGRGAGWEELPELLRKADILLSAINVPSPSDDSPHAKDAAYCLDAGSVKKLMRDRKQSPLFVIDLSVPRSLDARVRSLDNVYYYELDDLQVISNEHHTLRKKERENAEEIIRSQADHYMNWFRSLDVASLIYSFKGSLESIREEVTNRFVNKLSVPSIHSNLNTNGSLTHRRDKRKGRSVNSRQI